MTNSLASNAVVSASRPLITGRFYTLHLTSSPDDIAAAQRLRHDVFGAEPGFDTAMADVTDGRDSDRFDAFCDHLIVRRNTGDEVVGCYRMLPPPGAIAAGGMYTATEFDLAGLDPIAAQTVEMGRACVAVEHRSGSVMALMWSGILRYLDESGYRYAAGCTSVPVDCGDGSAPGAQIRGVRDLVRDRYPAPWKVHPYVGIDIDGRGLGDIDPPARLNLPPLLRGYLRLGAVVCGEPAHDVVFGVGDFVTVIDKQQANIRYLDRLRSAADAAEA